MTTASSSNPPSVTGLSFHAGGAEYTGSVFSSHGPRGHTAIPLWPRCGQLHAGDELFDSFVDRSERVLAQHRALRLVVELQVHPVHGEITPPLLGPADELAPQPGPGGLRRHRLGLEDVQVAGGAVDRAVALEQVVQAAAAVHV